MMSALNCPCWRSCFTRSAPWRLLVARDCGRVFVCNLRPQPPETAGYTDADHLRAVLDYGVPVDVMVVNGEPGDQAGVAPAIAEPTVQVVRAPMARADGGGHDPERLAAVLSGLTKFQTE